MTLFYADLRIYRQPDLHYLTVSVEVPAADMAAALALLQAWNAGLAVHSRIDTLNEESIYSSRRRNVEYLTFREAAIRLRPFLDFNDTDM